LFTENNTGRYGVLFNDSNERIANSYEVPNGIVRASEPDGNGGFFIGGTFNSIGDSSRLNLAHINNLGQVTSLINHTPNGRVNTIKKSGNRLYVGGEFNIVGKRIATHGAILQAENSQINMNERLNINGVVYCSVPDGGGGWYFGGSFYGAGDSIRYRLAHVDSYGNLYNWAPQLNGDVYTIALYGNYVLVGGAFDVVNGNPVPYFASIHGYDATRVNEGINIKPDDVVSSIVIDKSTLFLGGFFGRVNNQLRGAGASVDLKTGSLGGWNPNVSNGYITSMAISGSTMFIGGNFTKVNGQTRSYFATVSILNSSLGSLNPLFDGRINSILSLGGTFIVGGEFTIINGISRPFIAEFDTSSAVPTSWMPAPDGPVYALSIAQDKVFIGGAFNNVGGKKVAYLAGVNLTDAKVSNFDALPDGAVRTVSFQGSKLFAGGDFLNIGGMLRQNLFAVNLDKDKIDEVWKANHDGVVMALGLNKAKNLLYTGGGFNKVNEASRPFLAAISETDATLASFFPMPDDSVFAISYNDSFLYVGGNFTLMGVLPRYHLARFSQQNGIVAQPNYNVDGRINALLIDENKLYIGGLFTKVGPSSVSNLTSINANTGLIENPIIQKVNYAVNSLSLGNNKLYVGGAFTSYGDDYVNRVCKIDLTSGLVEPWPVFVNAEIFTTNFSKHNVFAGGMFTQAGGVSRNYFAAINASFGSLYPLNLNLNGNVNQIYVKDNLIATAGSFSMSDTSIRKNFLLYDINIRKLTPLSIELKSGEIRAINIKDSTVFLGGNFDSINNTGISRFASVNLINGNTILGLPSVNGIVNSLISDSNYLYVGGTFSNIGGNILNNLFRYQYKTKQTDPTWNANIVGHGLNTMLISDSLLYIAGGITKVGNSVRSNIANLSLKTAAVKGLAIDMELEVPTIAKSGQYLFVGGGYDMLTYNFRNYWFGMDITNSLLNNWWIMPDEKVQTMLTRKNLLYLGGSFGRVNGISQSYLSVFDTSNAPCTNTTLITSSRALAFCNGDSTILNFKRANGIGYVWLLNKFPIQNALDTFLVVKNAGKWSIRILDSTRGCVTSSNEIIVKVNSGPVVDRISQFDTIGICKNSTAIIGVDPMSSVQFTWYRNKLLYKSGDTLNKISINDTSEYQLRVTGMQSGCNSYSNIVKGSIIKPPVKPVIAGIVNPAIGASYRYTSIHEKNVTSMWSVSSGNLVSANNDTALVKWVIRTNSGLLKNYLISQAGCVSDTFTLTVNVGDSMIKLSDTLITVPGVGISKKIGVESNIEWGAIPISTGNWIEVTPSLGIFNDTILVKVNSNRTLVPRNGKVAVYSQWLEKYLSVNQLGSFDTVVIKPDSIYLGAEAKTDSVLVKSNYSWQVNGAFPWINLNKTSDSGSTYLRFSVLKNQTGQERTASFIISTGLVSSAFKIYQSRSTGISDFRKENCTVYPNPAGQVIFIASCFNDEPIVEIRDIIGRKVGEATITNGNWYLLPKLNSGVYFIRSSSGEMKKIHINQD